jgi:hypothetical protein
MLSLILNFITFQHLNVLTYVSCHDLLLGRDWSSQLHDASEATQQASPHPRRRQRKDPGVDSANVVPEKRPRKKNIMYTPRN